MCRVCSLSAATCFIVSRYAGVLLTLVAMTATSSAGVLNPNSFSSLGALSLAAGNYTLNTTTMQLRDAADNLLFTGTLFAQGTPSGVPFGGFNPNVAVFAFDSMTLGSNVTSGQSARIRWRCCRRVL